MPKCRMRVEAGIRAAAAAALLICLSTTAEAAPSLSTSAVATGEVFIGNASRAYAHQHTTDYGTNSASTSAGIDTTYAQNVADPGAPLGTTQVIWGVRAGGTGTASAGYGSLHAQSTAAFQALPGSYTFQGIDPSGSPYSRTYVTPLNKPEASGEAFATFIDSFTLNPVGSGSAGTTASVRFTMTLEAAITGYSVPGQLYGGSKATGALYMSENGDSYFPDDLLDTYVDSTTPASRTVTVTVDLGVGKTYFINDTLHVLSEVPTNDCTVPGCDQQSFIANASNTQLLNIDVLSPDVTLTTGSGTDYATADSSAVATPEPASIAVFGVGLLGVEVMRRRRLTLPSSGRRRIA